MDDALDPETEQRLWNEARSAIGEGDQARSLESLRTLADDGDWRASVSIGYIFESRGRQAHANYVIAAHWYSRSLAQEDQPESRLALARYYFFGLGGTYDFGRVSDHLSNFNVEEHPEAMLMLAELYRNGLGVAKDSSIAHRLCSQLVERGYPVGYIGLSKIAKAQRRYLAFARAVFGYFRHAVPIVVRDRKDPRGLGTGGPRGDYRRDYFARTEKAAREKT